MKFQIANVATGYETEERMEQSGESSTQDNGGKAADECNTCRYSMNRFTSGTAEQISTYHAAAKS